jgi:hypothetical protein
MGGAFTMGHPDLVREGHPDLVREVVEAARALSETRHDCCVLDRSGFSDRLVETMASGAAHDRLAAALAALDREDLGEPGELYPVPEP